jgi:hypothetical protein
LYGLQQLEMKNDRAFCMFVSLLDYIKSKLPAQNRTLKANETAVDNRSDNICSANYVVNLRILLYWHRFAASG